MSNAELMAELRSAANDRRDALETSLADVLERATVALENATAKVTRDMREQSLNQHLPRTVTQMTWFRLGWDAAPIAQNQETK